MTTILSVDLASKLSAVILRGPGGEISHQFDSRNKGALEFCKEVAMCAKEHDADLIVVEDVPYGVSSQAMVKPVLRLQGALLAYFTAAGVLDRVLFMSPSTWMKDFPGVQYATTKGLSKAAADQERINTALFHAQQLGYSPPDLVADWEHRCQIEGKKILKKDTNVLAKSMTDYVSAWLMSEFCRGRSPEELRALPGVSTSSL